MFDAGKLLNQMLGAGAKGAQGAGGIIGSLLQQSVSGLKDAGAAIEKQTGVGAKADAALKGATGKTTGGLLDQVKQMASQNKLATGAAIGGLGALLLGTKTGRGVAGGAAALGGLALVGGLAYKAWQNHQAGKQPAPTPAQLEAPPAASAFGETGNPTADDATNRLLIRAMIAAAACDGLIDNEERSRIVGSLEQAGLDTAAAKFLETEFANPASIRDLAAVATTPELALQAYTAARLAIEPDSAVEKSFLSDLAAALKIAPEQVAHLESVATSAKAG